MDHGVSKEKLVEMALTGLSWGECVAFEDHAETVFDDFEDDPNLSDKENRDRFWEAVYDAETIARHIIDLGIKEYLNPEKSEVGE